MYDRLRREISFSQGLIEGNQTTIDTPERKAIQRLLGVVDELVEALQQMDMRQAELEEYVESIDDDLNDLELLIYDDEDEDDGYIEITCPECGEDVLIDVEDLEDETIEQLCPKCHTVLVVEDTSDQEEDEVVVEEV